MKIVLDTNVLLQAISSRSEHSWLWDALRSEDLTLCFTTDIILEYEEVLMRKRNKELAKLVFEIITLMPNVVRVEKYYFFRIPTKDPDDQKFTDCAIACGADYLITEDSDFDELKISQFPIVNVLTPTEFRKVFDVHRG